MKFLDLPNEKISTKGLIGLILLAYLFSFAVRLIWVYQFADYAPFHYNGELMINTNDGYFFASGAQKALFGLHEYNFRVPNWLNYGVTFFTVLLTKITPFSLETIILYMPALISSLVVIPIILIARVFNATIWGFFSALLGSIVWSYYNRTMTGYYDTDMFAAMAPMFVLYFFIASVKHFTLKSALYAAIMIVIYPFLYDQGKAVVFAMSLIYFAYLLYYHRDEELTYKAIILVSLSTLPFYLLISSPFNYLLNIAVLIMTYLFLEKREFTKSSLYITSAVMVVAFLYFGNVFSLIVGKVTYYLSRGVDEEGLHFFQVNQTVREAGKIPFFPTTGGSNISERVSGSAVGFVLAVVGYILLVIRYRPFILALPLIGIGIFAHWGGLRFTVFATSVAAMSVVYIFYLIASHSDKKILRYSLITMLTVAIIYPNIKHIINYKVPTVFTKPEVDILKKLDKIASDKDYTLTWWDYGYPIWFYSDTNTLIDGGKHGHDNFIISKILNTSSPTLAANLSRLSVERYIKIRGIVSDTIFSEKDPNDLFDELESDSYKLPEKSRDIYLFMPKRMLNIFPTVGLFSNLDLVTGEKKRDPFFYKSDYFKDKGVFIDLGRGVGVDKREGAVILGNQKIPMKRFVTVGMNKDGKSIIKSQDIDPNGLLSVMFLPSYGEFLVVDDKMYNSMYIQMFLLDNYDKELFEKVISSPYAKVFKLKR
jgi:dolichyl-diphosphooligosaccharide--protein glycosyltransferase/undecaprenyl-diphosphooligosaccharide--protein glycosyltransferase